MICFWEVFDERKRKKASTGKNGCLKFEVYMLHDRFYGAAMTGIKEIDLKMSDLF